MKIGKKESELAKAVERGDVRRAQTLLDKGAVAVDARDWPMLYRAAWYGSIDVARLLLQRGADIESRNENGMTALNAAARCGHGDIVGLLIDHGADIEAKDKNGLTALCVASSGGHMDIVRRLLARGADLGSKSNNGDAALHFTASRGWITVASLLLQHGADVETRNENGETALHCAASSGQIEVVRLLLEHHVNIVAEDNHEREQGRELMEIPEEVFNQGANAVNTYITALTESDVAVPDEEDRDRGRMLVLKSMLQDFGLAYPADNERMTTTSSLIVPAYWKMRLDDDKQLSQRDWSDLALGKMGLDAMQQVHRYEWEYRFEFQCLPNASPMPSANVLQLRVTKWAGDEVSYPLNCMWELLVNGEERVVASMLTTNEALALVEALVQQIPEPLEFDRNTEHKFSVVARRSLREPIEVDCRAIRLTLRFIVSRNYERSLQHIYELIDLLSWLAACPGCTVPENPFLWQKIIQLLVGDTISCETIIFGDAAAFPRWIISFKAEFGDERYSGFVSRPETFDRDHSFVQSLFTRPLVDADNSEHYVQAMLHVRPLVEQPLEIPIGIDLDCSSQPSRIRFYEQIRAFVKGLRANAVPNRIKFDSFGLSMNDRFLSIEQMDETHDMELLMRENSDVWVSRFQAQAPLLEYESYGSDNKDVMSIERVRHEYGSLLTHLLRDPQPGDPPLCIQVDAYLGTWQASCVIDYDETPEFEVLATSERWVGILVPGYGFGWVQSSLVERVWTEPLEDVMQPSHSVQDLILNSWGFEQAPVLLREIGGSLQTLALRSTQFTDEMTEDTVEEVIRACPNVTNLALPSIKLDPLVRAYEAGVCQVTSLTFENGFEEGPELLDSFLAMLRSSDHAGSVMLQTLAFEFRSFQGFSSYPLTSEACLKVVTQMMLESKNLRRMYVVDRDNWSRFGFDTTCCHNDWQNTHPLIALLSVRGDVGETIARVDVQLWAQVLEYLGPNRTIRLIKAPQLDGPWRR
ncbi:hypothetical protein ATCC90586_003059 [Pythium insidiosum]|nr:hypothetical protein ATCC90586_003059 [Pythium insidiosum]